MRHFFITLYLLGISLFSSAQQEEKVALLITHYGSSDPQTRALTLDVVTREAQEAFPQFTVREAYISPIVRKRLAKEGVYKDSPTDALLKLRAEGYRTIYVQSTTLIEGSEMTSVRRDADNLRPFFKEIRVGNPLLYSVEDCEKVIDILTAEQPEKKEDIVYVGHGNQLPSTATYAMLDFMMKAHGLKNFHVSTIEGYPTLDATLLQLKETRPKSVTLVPLLLVCGNHTKEDIAGVWKTELEKQGHTVFIFTTTDKDVNRYEDWQIIRIPSVPFFAFKDRRVAYRGFSKALEIARQYQLDIIHTQTEFSLGLLGVWIAKELKIPVLHTYHTHMKITSAILQMEC